jgi:hypothetical protein
MSDTEILQGLPGVTWLRRGPTGARTIYAASDFLYFQKYAPLLIQSLRSHHLQDVGLTLHVMDMTDAEGADVLRMAENTGGLDITVTTEWTGLRQSVASETARVYYHAVRFIRLWEYLEQAPAGPLLFVDMDTLFPQSPAPLFELVNHADLAVPFLPARLETRNRILACVNVFANTTASRSYLRRVAAYLAATWQQGYACWGMDQVALYAALMVTRQHRVALSVAPIEPYMYGNNFEAGRVLWAGKLDEAARNDARIMATVNSWACA